MLGWNRYVNSYGARATLHAPCTRSGSAPCRIGSGDPLSVGQPLRWSMTKAGPESLGKEKRHGQLELRAPTDFCRLPDLSSSAAVVHRYLHDPDQITAIWPVRRRTCFSASHPGLGLVTEEENAAAQLPAPVCHAPRRIKRLNSPNCYPESWKWRHDWSSELSQPPVLLIR